MIYLTPLERYSHPNFCSPWRDTRDFLRFFLPGKFEIIKHGCDCEMYFVIRKFWDIWDFSIKVFCKESSKTDFVRDFQEFEIFSKKLRFSRKFEIFSKKLKFSRKFEIFSKKIDIFSKKLRLSQKNWDFLKKNWYFLKKIEIISKKLRFSRKIWHFLENLRFSVKLI